MVVRDRAATGLVDLYSDWLQIVCGTDCPYVRCCIRCNRRFGSNAESTKAAPDGPGTAFAQGPLLEGGSDRSLALMEGARIASGGEPGQLRGRTGSPSTVPIRLANWHRAISFGWPFCAREFELDSPHFQLGI